MVEQAYIVNPVGIDKEIQIMRKYLQDKSTIEFVFGKATKFYNSKTTEPVIYIGDNEYNHILQNDNVKSHLVFYLHEESDNSNYPFEVFDISVHVFIDLNKTYPAFLHRAEEEVIMTIRNLISNKSQKWEVQKTVRGAKKSLSEFNLKIDDFTQLQPLFTFKLDYKVKIDSNINC